MGKTEKKINKILIGAIIGSAVLGVGGLSMTPKGKSFWKRIFHKSHGWTRFLIRGVRQMKNEFFGTSPKKKRRRKTKKKIISKKIRGK